MIRQPLSEFYFYSFHVWCSREVPPDRGCHLPSATADSVPRRGPQR